MIEQQRINKVELNKRVQGVKTVWIDNDQNTNDHSKKQLSQFDEEFKKDHQNYLKSRMKMKEEERKRKIEEFGLSSSDEDESLKIKIKPALIQAQKQIDLKLLKVESVKIRSKSSQKEEQDLKKSGNIKIGSGKHVQNPNQFEILVASKKGVDVWIDEKLVINQKFIVLLGIQCPFYHINKLKLIFNDVGTKCFKLKISWKNQEIIFAASYQKLFEDFPEVYYIFANIITTKINLMGKKIVPITELKPQGIPEAIIKNSSIYGRIFKKSRVIGRWSQIFAVINKQGLYYYKKITQKGELLVPRTTIGELWTRFQFQGDLLIIKLFQNSHKIQLGIPIQNYLHAHNWLFCLYTLVFKNN